MSAPAARHQSNRRDKRTHILNVAAKALNLYGVSHTSFGQIAQLAGLSRNALYYYVKDQKDLVFQCYHHSCTQMAEALERARENRTDALDIIDAFIEGVVGEDLPEIAALSEVALLRPEQHRVIVDMNLDLRRQLAHVIAEGVRQGAIRPCQADLVAAAIIGLISWVSTAHRWRGTERLSDRELIEVMKDILHVGIAQDRSAPIDYVPFDLSPPVLSIKDAFDPDAVAAIRQAALPVAASWLFNLKGVDATTLEEIAVRIGVTRKVIYQHAGDKLKLVIQCYRRAFRFHEDLVVRMTELPGARIDAITANTHASAEASMREDVAPFAPLTGHESWPAEEREELQATAARVISLAMDVYRRGQAEGSIRNINPRAAIMVLPGLFNWLPKWLALLDEEERAAVPQEMAKLYRLGLRAI